MTAVIESGQQKRLVEIAAPINPRDGERGHRISLMDRDGLSDETYLAPTLDCALGVAALLLRGEEVPKDYFREVTAAPR